jgi:hypothetical protein
MAQLQLQSPGHSELSVIWGMILFVGTGIALYYQILANRRKAHESHQPERRILPQPLGVRTVHDPASQDDLESLEEDLVEKMRSLSVHLAEKIEDNRQHTTEQIKSLWSEISSVRTALQKLANELHRAVGVLEGNRRGTDRRE